MRLRWIQMGALALLGILELVYIAIGSGSIIRSMTILALVVGYLCELHTNEVVMR